MDNNKKNSLGFYLVITGLILGVLETIFITIDISLYLNIIIEVVAIILSVLVYLGILKNDVSDTTDIVKQNEEIKEQLHNSIKNKKNSNKNGED